MADLECSKRKVLHRLVNFFSDCDDDVTAHLGNVSESVSY